ncbi:hypothetical protein CIB48_g2637 [Xylaria polymorpha]|nr:hypothetical protein CIB48_g2637 [Xylaria polymorpha]
MRQSRPRATDLTARGRDRCVGGPVRGVDSRGGPLAPAQLVDALGGGPAQQAGGAEDEAPDDDLVLAAVALDAGGEDVGGVGVDGVLADGQVLGQAEGVGALGAGGLGAELDEGAILEARALAEQGRGYASATTF